MLGAELSVDATALLWLTAEEAQSTWKVDVSELWRAHRRAKGPTKQRVGSKACDLFIQRERTDIAKECFDLQAASHRKCSRTEYRMLFHRVAFRRWRALPVAQRRLLMAEASRAFTGFQCSHA